MEKRRWGIQSVDGWVGDMHCLLFWFSILSERFVQRRPFSPYTWYSVSLLAIQLRERRALRSCAQRQARLMCYSMICYARKPRQNRNALQWFD